MNRQSLSKEEIIRKIELLGGKYDADNKTFDVYDQLLICESIAESTPVNPDDEYGKIIMSIKKANGINGYVNGSVNGSCKRSVNFELSESKLRAIAELNNFRPQKTPLEIEQCLKEIFSDFQTKEYWWLHVAQTWTQRQINWVLKYVLKLQSSGRIKKDPAACFTYFILFRRKRRSL